MKSLNQIRYFLFAGKIIRRPGRAVAKAVVSCTPYLIIAGAVILEVVDDKEITRHQAPDVVFPWTVGIDSVDLIDMPIIRRIQHKLAGVGAFLPDCLCPLIFGRGFRCILYGVCISAEIDFRILYSVFLPFFLPSEFLFFPLLALFILKKRRNSFRLFNSKR